MNIAKFLRAPFSKNICERLRLKVAMSARKNTVTLIEQKEG